MALQNQWENCHWTGSHWIVNVANTVTAINFELREDNINIPNPQGETTHFKNRDGVPQKERERGFKMDKHD